MTTQKRSGPARLVAGIAAFVLLCGVVLVLAAGPRGEAEGADDDGPTQEQRITRALDQLHAAEEALRNPPQLRTVEREHSKLRRTLRAIQDNLDGD